MTKIKGGYAEAEAFAGRGSGVGLDAQGKAFGAGVGAEGIHGGSVGGVAGKGGAGVVDCDMEEMNAVFCRGAERGGKRAGGTGMQKAGKGRRRIRGGSAAGVERDAEGTVSAGGDMVAGKKVHAGGKGVV